MLLSSSQLSVFQLCALFCLLLSLFSPLHLLLFSLHFLLFSSHCFPSYTSFTETGCPLYALKHSWTWEHDGECRWNRIRAYLVCTAMDLQELVLWSVVSIQDSHHWITWLISSSVILSSFHSLIGCLHIVSYSYKIPTMWCTCVSSTFKTTPSSHLILVQIS